MSQLNPLCYQNKSEGKLRNSFHWEACPSIWVACWDIWVISGTSDKLHFYSTFTIDGSTRALSRKTLILPRMYDPYSCWSKQKRLVCAPIACYSSLIERKNVRSNSVLQVYLISSQAFTSSSFTKIILHVFKIDILAWWI